MQKIGAFLLDTIQTIVLALSIFLIVYLFLLQPHIVNGQSMEPSFDNGEYLLTDKLSYRLNEPKRGDVIVFSAPPSPRDDYIKRIIGLPNEIISIKDGKVYIDNKQLVEDYLPKDTYTTGGPFLPEGKEIRIGQDEYFVMGDNRAYSSDSRYWGLVPRKNIVGKAWLIYYPPQKAGFVPQPSFVTNLTNP